MFVSFLADQTLPVAR